MVPNSPVASRHSKPRLALAIGGSDARTVAALGVAEVLAEAGLAFDAVAGCGTGALMAVLIAQGQGRDSAHALATRLWDPAVARRTRWRARLRFLVPNIAGIDDSFSLFDDRPLAGAFVLAFGRQRFEDLPISLRVQVTETTTGRSMILRRGPVATALLASSALPLLHSGPMVDGRRLSGGAQSDPLAVGAVDDAQVIVSVGFPGILPKRVVRPAHLVAQAGTTLMNNLMRARVEAMKASGRPFVHIEPRFDGEVDTWDAGVLEELHQIGRETARRRLGEIRGVVARAQALATLQLPSGVMSVPRSL